MMNSVLDLFKRIAFQDGDSHQKQLVKEYRDAFESGFRDMATYGIFTVKDVEHEVSVQDVNDQNNKDTRDDKYIITPLDCDIKAGDIGIWDGDKKHYLIVMEESKTVKANKRFKAYPCNYLLKWVDFKNKKVCESYCAFSDATLYTDGLFEETRIKSPEEMARIILPREAEVSKFIRGQRICVDHDFYEITSVKRLDEGITRIMMKIAMKNEFDDEDLYIADYKRLDMTIVPQPPLTPNAIEIEIVGKGALMVGQKSEYRAIIKDDQGQEVVGKTAIFSVSEGLSIIESSDNKLVVKAVLSGKAKITAEVDSVVKEYAVLIRRL